MDREDFMEVMETEMGIGSVQKGHLSGRKWKNMSGGWTGKENSGHSERTKHAPEKDSWCRRAFL